MENLLFNPLPRPTFRWLQVNHTEGTIWAGNTAAKVSVDAREGVVSPIADKALLNPEYTGVEASALQDVAENFTNGVRIHVPKGQEEVVSIGVEASGEVAEKLRLQIHLEEEANLQLFLYIVGSATGGHVTTFTEVKGEDRSSIKVAKVQLLEGNVQQFEHRYTWLGEESQADFVNVEIGGAENYLNYLEELVGEKSEVTHDLAYCGHGTQKI